MSFTRTAGRNFKAFHNLCGDSTLKNVIIVTNMWGDVVRDVGEAREKELITTFFKSFPDKGAQLTRHHNTAQCAHDIIRCIMKNRPNAPQIRRELALVLPPAGPSTGNSDTWYDGLPGVTPPTPFLIPSRLEQVATNRMASTELRPSSGPEYSLQCVLGCDGEAFTDTDASAFVSSLLAYNHLAVDQSHPEGPLSAVILPHPTAMESQVTTSHPNCHWTPQEAYDRSTSSSLLPPLPHATVSLPQILHKIPQEVYNHGRKQWDFTPSECIYFGVNGHLGMNMGDALQRRLMNLDGRDEPVLRDGGSAISCRFLVRLLWSLLSRIGADTVSSSLDTLAAVHIRYGAHSGRAVTH